MAFCDGNDFLQTVEAAKQCFQDLLKIQKTSRFVQDFHNSKTCKTCSYLQKGNRCSRFFASSPGHLLNHLPIRKHPTLVVGLSRRPLDRSASAGNMQHLKACPWDKNAPWRCGAELHRITMTHGDPMVSPSMVVYWLYKNINPYCMTGMICFVWHANFQAASWGARCDTPYFGAEDCAIRRIYFHYARTHTHSWWILLHSSTRKDAEKFFPACHMDDIDYIYFMLFIYFGALHFSAFTVWVAQNVKCVECSVPCLRWRFPREPGTRNQIA